MQHRLRQLLLGGAFVAAGFTVGALADDHAAQAAPKPPPVEQPGGVLDRAAQLPDMANDRAKAVVARVTEPKRAEPPAKAKAKATKGHSDKPTGPRPHKPRPPVVKLPPVKLPPVVDVPPVRLPPPPKPAPDAPPVVTLPEPSWGTPPLPAPTDEPAEPIPAEDTAPAPAVKPAPAAPPAVLPVVLPVVIGPVPLDVAADPGHRHHADTLAAAAADLCRAPYDRPGALPTPTHPAAGGSHAHPDRQCAPHPPASQPAGTTASGSAPGTACARSTSACPLSPPALGRLAHARARSTIPDGPTTLLDPRPA